jgi:hypothetical protein
VRRDGTTFTPGPCRRVGSCERRDGSRSPWQQANYGTLAPLLRTDIYKTQQRSIHGGCTRCAAPVRSPCWCRAVGRMQGTVGATRKPGPQSTPCCTERPSRSADLKSEPGPVELDRSRVHHGGGESPRHQALLVDTPCRTGRGRCDAPPHGRGAPDLELCTPGPTTYLLRSCQRPADPDRVRQRRGTAHTSQKKANGCHPQRPSAAS